MKSIFVLINIIYLNVGRNGTRPLEFMHIKGKTFEEQVIHLHDNVFSPAGLEVIKWSKMPYLCEGNLQRSYFWLTDAVFVLKVKQLQVVPIINHHQLVKSFDLNSELTENENLQCDRLQSTSETCSSFDVVVDMPQ